MQIHGVAARELRVHVRGLSDAAIRKFRVRSTWCTTRILGGLNGTYCQYETTSSVVGTRQARGSYSTAIAPNVFDGAAVSIWLE